MEKILYSVNPKRPITEIPGLCIRTPKSVELDKDELLICLKKATVYRNFSLEGKVERVTLANVDRIHRKEYISEEDWKKFQIKENSEGSGKVVTPVVDEKKEEPVVAPVIEPVVEEEKVVEPIAEVTEAAQIADTEDVVLSDDEEPEAISDSTNA